MTTFNIRLLCLDIDGTLLDTSHSLPPENRAAVQYAAKRGVVISLMSARPPQAIAPIADALGVSGPIACFGGGLILSDGARLSDCRIPTDAALRVAAETARHGVHLSVYRDFDWFVARNDRWSIAESTITGLIPSEAPLDELLGAWKTCGAHKLLCMGERVQIDELYAVLRTLRLPLMLQRSKDEYLEIVPAETGKDAAMQTLCRALNIPPACVMAIGDHDIDVPLLRAAGIGIAMGNASPAAKQAARFLTDTNDRAGVAQAIYQWIKEDTNL
ncbi:MAG: Cof-type HAD-IIB family hydrolase [Clostridiales bacterium]|nr:Cof-type HAD-IIB family hydrolase [Clostridiales bacterium]